MHGLLSASLEVIENSTEWIIIYDASHKHGTLILYYIISLVDNIVVVK